MRTGSSLDVLLDLSGAISAVALAVYLQWRWRRPLFVPREPA